MHCFLVNTYLGRYILYTSTNIYIKGVSTNTVFTLQGTKMRVTWGLDDSLIVLFDIVLFKAENRRYELAVLIYILG